MKKEDAEETSVEDVDEEVIDEDEVSEDETSESEDTTTSEPEREMFKIKCSECGKDAEVPFKPTEGRPIYCRDCFMKHRKPRRSFGYNRRY